MSKGFFLFLTCYPRVQQVLEDVDSEMDWALILKTGSCCLPVTVPASMLLSVKEMLEASLLSIGRANA